MGPALEDGIDGIHRHWTNTKNMPVEAVEIAYPLMVEEYSLIAGTGGAGQFRGGNGIRRAVRILMEEGDLSIISNRRSTSPFGILGGKDGAAGKESFEAGGRKDQEIARPDQGSSEEGGCGDC